MSETYSPIPELNLLKEFDDQCTEFYSPGFELREYDDKEFLADSEFADGVIPFAQATHSGSLYALWRCDDRVDLATLPVLFLGDEGDIYVVAHDLRDLFWDLLDEEFDGPPPTHQEYLATRQAYRDWLEQNFGPTPPKHDRSPMEEHGWPFVDWLLSAGEEDLAEVMVKNLELFEVPRPQERV